MTCEGGGEGEGSLGGVLTQMPPYQKKGVPQFFLSFPPLLVLIVALVYIWELVSGAKLLLALPTDLPVFTPPEPLLSASIH